MKTIIRVISLILTSLISFPAIYSMGYAQTFKAALPAVPTFSIPPMSPETIQQLQDSSKLFGGIAGAAIGGVLLYYAYKAWTSPKEAVYTLKNVINKVNEDVANFLGLLWIFNQQYIFKEIYNKKSAVYTHYNTLIQDYSTGRFFYKKVLLLPHVKNILKQIDSLKGAVKIPPPDTKQQQQKYDNAVANLSSEFINISNQINDFVINRLPKTGFFRTTFPPKLQMDELADEILKITDAVHKFYLNALVVYGFIERDIPGELAPGLLGQSIPGADRGSIEKIETLIKTHGSMANFIDYQKINTKTPTEFSDLVIKPLLSDKQAKSLRAWFGVYRGRAG